MLEQGPDLTAVPAGDPADTERLRTLMSSTARWCLTVYLPSAVTADGRLTELDAATGRSTSGAALSLAVGLRCRAFDGSVPVDAALVSALRTIRACAAAHVSVGGTWGRSWQSPLVSGQLGLATLLLGEQVDPDVRLAVERIVRDEADHLAGVPLHYLRDVDGRYLTQGDTGAEEESWRARGLSVALALLPAHLNAPRWFHALVLRQLASYATPADVDRQDLLHRSPFCSWLAGSNLEPNGDLQNHHANPQPNYMRPVHHLAAVMHQRIVGQRVSPSALHNLDLMYAALRRLYTEDGGLHYPAGTDVRSRAVVLYANDVQHRALGIGGAEALRWERLHGRIALGQVQPDGRVEEPGGTEPFGPVHPDIAAKLAEAYLALVLGPLRDGEVDGTTLAGAPAQGVAVRCPSYGREFPDTAGQMLVAARWVASRGVMPGYDDGTFRPSDPLPRATALLTLERAAGRAIDVSAETSGAPEETLTRGQAVVLLWRSASSPVAPPAGFTDVSGEVAEAAAWAWALGITTGATATTFAPGTLINRGQWAVMLHRQHTA